MIPITIVFVFVLVDPISIVGWIDVPFLRNIGEDKIFSVELIKAPKI